VITSESSLVEGMRLQQTTEVSRRGLLRVGSAFVATLAALSTSKEALANGYCNCTPHCCCLKYCNTCSPILCDGWSCPAGYQDSWWVCQSGGWTCTCGECTHPGNGCFTGPWGGCSVAYCY